MGISLNMSDMPLTIYGNCPREGSYLLFIDLASDADVTFGRFRNGAAISLEKGCYLYVGSALGSSRKSFPLAGRLLRHATRSQGHPPHTVVNDLIGYFSIRGFDPKKAPKQKQLHWHIDYLLDLPSSEISRIVMIMSPLRLETRLAHLVSSIPEVVPVADRLGAQDAASGTHLFFVNDPAKVLNQLEIRLPDLLVS